jgi:hypothetical protein
MAYGPQPVLIVECFPARMRHSGSSLSFRLASDVTGGPAPLIATTLPAVTTYVLLSCVVGIATMIPLPDYTNRDISEQPVLGWPKRLAEASSVG